MKKQLIEAADSVIKIQQLINCRRKVHPFRLSVPTETTFNEIEKELALLGFAIRDITQRYLKEKKNAKRRN